MTRIQSANINWEQDKALSGQFDAVYFNTEGGQAETSHVFLDGNHLTERFAGLTEPHFTIGETGFGTGLNFLCTRALWLQRAPDHAHLHFISVEKYPLNPEDLASALAHWPEFAEAGDQILAQYPPLVNGFHRLELDAGRISLTLIFDDAIQGFSQLQGTVDAWFLDGFAPASNPEMWSPALFSQVARLSHAQTTLATFTVAGSVRGALQDAGFSVAKSPGFRLKHEMLSGAYSGTYSGTASGSAAGRPPGRTASPWFDAPAPQHRPESVLILGGGLAGCTAAYALARRGIRVRLLEQTESLATGGSGNRQGALYAKLPVRPTKQGLLHSTGLYYSHHQLQQMMQQELIGAEHWQACGLLQLAQSDKEAARQQQLIDAAEYPNALVQAVSAAQASTLAGCQVPHSGLFFPRAGWVSPVDFCRALVAHPLIEVHTDTRIVQLQQDTVSQHWIARSDTGVCHSAAVVIVATAGAASALSQLEHLPLKAIRGQVSETSAELPHPHLKTVVCGDGYIAPPMAGTYCFGATFDLHDAGTELRDEDHASNLATLSTALPSLAQAFRQGALQGRVSFRCSTPDYLPLIGPAPDCQRFIEDYGRLRQDRNWRFDTAPSHHAGLYLSVGHGSKGLLTCPIGAELLAGMICNEPLPLGRTLTEALSPARFIIKNLIRRSI